MITINRTPSRKQLRWFAALWLPLFGLMVGTMLIWRAHATTAAQVVWGATAIAAVLSLISPAIARWVFLGLSYASFPIGFVVSWVALTVLYFVVLTPIGVVMRLSGRDPLRLKPEPNAETYWTPRRSRETEASRAFRQF
jgi:hypothetical protein